MGSGWKYTSYMFLLPKPVKLFVFVFVFVDVLVFVSAAVAVAVAVVGALAVVSWLLLLLLLLLGLLRSKSLGSTSILSAFRHCKVQPLSDGSHIMMWHIYFVVYVVDTHQGRPNARDGARRYVPSI